ncbi:MAG: hypothetical protein JSS72_09835 [Armatimonadetes bacterium]|nr:hypothetical protein [Armatimonadota bacterium]
MVLASGTKKVKSKKRLWIGFGILVAAIWFFTGPFVFWMLTGQWWPLSHIESLQNPVAVDGFSKDGLHLHGGKVLMLPGYKELPESSQILTAATKEGVEISPSGRVYGLLRIWHWCGNDPLKNDVRRIDLSSLLDVLQQGKPLRQMSEEKKSWLAGSSEFREWGWSLSGYVKYKWYVDGTLDKFVDIGKAEKPRTASSRP